MTKITSLADEIRNRIAQPPPETQEQPQTPKVKKLKAEEAKLLQLIRAYDNSNHKSLVHVRFDEKTVQTLNHFKMATGVDVTRLVAFAVKQLFEGNPELKAIIKQFIQNMTL
ncbi:hypothetical protein [Mucilaginibacter sp. KACC 22063]|uniref:hypothetical protein n=1 Tax=Mucilaginibacter sp. KACC 22063 TaxID=3025666 RepID=UPI0023651851|nr:hypothetical protein [Mucilaginibacter sp. KACC 22063]WDF55876.1 hypothetical protein PQ461_02220 [Mucilaginibacter sp. KACC 22063]